jgi:hypothetical protein
MCRTRYVGMPSSAAVTRAPLALSRTAAIRALSCGR